MAYNNFFPAGYQPAYYQPQYNVQPQQQQTAQSGIIWVQGEAGAKSYLVAPNTTVQLWDSEKQVIYLKSADASGMPSMKILDYTIREQNQSAVARSVALDSDKYVTKEELHAFQESLEKRFKSLSGGGVENEQSAVQPIRE